MKNLALLLTVPILIACGNSEPSQSTKEAVWIEKGKSAVRHKLKDGDSAIFRSTFFHRGKDNVPMSCGEVNSKNSFGAMTGYQRYISAASHESTFLEEQIDDFDIVWNKFCK